MRALCLLLLLASPLPLLAQEAAVTNDGKFMASDLDIDVTFNRF